MKKRSAINKMCLAMLSVTIVLSGCGKADTFMKPYDAISQQSEFSFVGSAQQGRASAFAAELCVANENVIPASSPILCILYG